MLNPIDIREKQGLMVIMAEFEDVRLHGVARCDHVSGASGKTKLRAKFGHGIKAILDFDEYGDSWQAEAAEESTQAATAGRTPRGGESDEGEKA